MTLSGTISVTKPVAKLGHKTGCDTPMDSGAPRFLSDMCGCMHESQLFTQQMGPAQ